MKGSKHSDHSKNGIHQCIKIIINYRQMRFIPSMQSWLKYQCNSPYQQTKEEVLYEHMNWHTKNIWQNSTLFHDKNIQQTNRKKFPQCNDGKVEKPYS